METLETPKKAVALNPDPVSLKVIEMKYFLSLYFLSNVG